MEKRQGVEIGLNGGEGDKVNDAKIELYLFLGGIYFKPIQTNPIEA